MKLLISYILLVLATVSVLPQAPTATPAPALTEMEMLEYFIDSDTPCDCMAALGGFPMCPFPGNMNWEAFDEACVAFTNECADIQESTAACIAAGHPPATCIKFAKAGYGFAVRHLKMATSAACEQ